MNTFTKIINLKKKRFKNSSKRFFKKNILYIITYDVGEQSGDRSSITQMYFNGMEYIANVQINIRN